MKLLVFGKTGQIGSEMARHQPPGLDVNFLDRSAANLGNIRECTDVIKRHNCDVVINAAGATHVDMAEMDVTNTLTINALCPAAMASECARQAIPFLHISSDYVFDGTTSSPIAAAAQTSPINIYGQSKAQGEALIAATTAQYLILRTSWVFSVHKTNFVKKIMALADDNMDLAVVSDQIACPTPASALADAIYKAAQSLVSKRAGGIYHFAGDKPVSRADFARKIVQAAGRSTKIIPVSTASLADAVKRPLYTVLDCDSFTQDYGIAPPDWERELELVVSEIAQLR